MNTDNASLLDDLPLTPDMLSVYTEAESLVDFDEPLSNWHGGTLPTQSNGLPVISKIGYYDDETPGPLASLYAKVLGLPVLTGRGLTANHWTNMRSISLVDDLEFTYTVNRTKASGRFIGYWCSDCDVIVCDSITVSVSLRDADDASESLAALPTALEITGESFYDPLQNVVIVTKGGSPHGIIHQLNSFMDDDIFSERARDEEAEVLARVIYALLSDSPVSYLQSILDGARCDTGILKDSVFNIRVVGGKLVAEAA